MGDDWATSIGWSVMYIHWYHYQHVFIEEVGISTVPRQNEARNNQRPVTVINYGTEVTPVHKATGHWGNVIML